MPPAKPVLDISLSPMGMSGNIVGVIVLLMIPIVGWIILIVWMVNSGKAASVHNQELARWEKAMHRWEQIYYCGRCDRVFLRDQNQAIPRSMVSTLLYDQVSNPNNSNA